MNFDLLAIFRNSPTGYLGLNFDEHLLHTLYMGSGNSTPGTIVKFNDKYRYKSDELLKILDGEEWTCIQRVVEASGLLLAGIYKVKIGDHSAVVQIFEASEKLYSVKACGPMDLDESALAGMLAPAISDNSDKVEASVSMIVKRGGGTSLRPIDMSKHNKMDLALHYGKDFVQYHEALVKKLAATKKGIIILHGEPGCGKSTYVRHLAATMNKKFIYVPNSMAMSFSSPETLSFFDWMKPKDDDPKNIVFIIEDGETLVQNKGNRNGVLSDRIGFHNV